MPDPLPADPTHAGACRIAAALRARALSALELVDVCLDRIARIQPQLNAVVQVGAERARAEARACDEALARGQLRGPLHGVPVTIKDSLDAEGLVSAAGTRGRAGFVPAADAIVVARLRRAGAIVLGKTNTPELTIGVETVNPVYGRTSNPHDPARTCGGSSGGSAAAVATGAAFLDIGSDTAGSLRWPAHCCGVAGFKPTAGRVPRSGHALPPGLGAIDILTQLGPLARRVEDLRLALALMQGPDGHDPSVVPAPALRGPDAPAPRGLAGLRVIGFVDNGSDTTDPEVAEAVESVLRFLAAAGARVERTCPADLQRAHALSKALRAADGRAWLRRLLQASGTTEPDAFTAASIARTEALGAVEFGLLLERADALRSSLLGFMQDHDVIVSPVAGSAALLHGEWTAAMGTGLLDYTQGHNLLGWPAGCVNAGWTRQGLPIGVQVAAPVWCDDLVLDVLAAIEAHTGGWHPPALIAA